MVETIVAQLDKKQLMRHLLLPPHTAVARLVPHMGGALDKTQGHTQTNRSRLFDAA
jgi:hypothetical protein